MKVYYSHEKSKENTLVLESDDPLRISAAREQCSKEIPTLQGEFWVVGSDNQRILSVWYSDRYDEPIQSRHNVTHPEYRSIWMKPS
jgi:hypothetical protein